jgi:hypothetical protein
MNYDGDHVQCHLCGRWLRMVGGHHLLSAHDITLDRYREMFQLHKTVSTAAPHTSERKRATMLEQISSGQRDQSVLINPSPPTIGRWRSLASLHPQLLSEWHPSHNADIDPAQIGPHSTRNVWWRCPRCSHEWLASPHHRIHHGAGCPACGRQRSIVATIARNRAPDPTRANTGDRPPRPARRIAPDREPASGPILGRGRLRADRVVALQQHGV